MKRIALMVTMLMAAASTSALADHHMEKEAMDDGMMEDKAMHDDMTDPGVGKASATN